MKMPSKFAALEQLGELRPVARGPCSARERSSGCRHMPGRLVGDAVHVEGVETDLSSHETHETGTGPRNPSSAKCTDTHGMIDPVHGRRPLPERQRASSAAAGRIGGDRRRCGRDEVVHQRTRVAVSLRDRGVLHREQHVVGVLGDRELLLDRGPGRQHPGLVVGPGGGDHLAEVVEVRLGLAVGAAPAHRGEVAGADEDAVDGRQRGDRLDVAERTRVLHHREHLDVAILRRDPLVGVPAVAHGAPTGEAARAERRELREVRDALRVLDALDVGDDDAIRTEVERLLDGAALGNQHLRQHFQAETLEQGDEAFEDREVEGAVLDVEHDEVVAESGDDLADRAASIREPGALLESVRHVLPFSSVVTASGRGDHGESTVGE